MLLFDEATGEFLDNVRHYGKKRLFEFELASSETWEEIEERLSSNISIGDAIYQWAQDAATACHPLSKAI